MIFLHVWVLKIGVSLLAAEGTAFVMRCRVKKICLSVLCCVLCRFGPSHSLYILGCLRAPAEHRFRPQDIKQNVIGIEACAAIRLTESPDRWLALRT